MTVYLLLKAMINLNIAVFNIDADFKGQFEPFNNSSIP